MPAPFAAHEASINAAVKAHLANATATFSGGVLVDGIFRLPTIDALGLVLGDHPTFEALAADLASVSDGAAVTINSIAYTVASRRPDGTGNLTLVLQDA